MGTFPTYKYIIKKTIHICLLSVPSFPVLLWLKPSLLSTSPPHSRTHKIGLRTLGSGGSGRGTRIVRLDAVGNHHAIDM